MAVIIILSVATFFFVAFVVVTLPPFKGILARIDTKLARWIDSW